MPWIESHSDIWSHHKTRTLCRALGITKVQAVGHMLSLWHFVLDNAWRDADLAAWGDDGIEEAARWEGKPGAFVKAAREALLLDGSVVHGWMDRAGILVRDRIRKEVSRSVPGVVQDNSRTYDGRNPATVPYRTLPYPTIKTTADAVDFTQVRLPYGKDKGRIVAEMGVEECEFYLQDIRLGSKVRAALEARIAAKRSEMTPKQQKAYQ